MVKNPIFLAKNRKNKKPRGWGDRLAKQQIYVQIAFFSWCFFFPSPRCRGPGPGVGINTTGSELTLSNHSLWARRIVLLRTMRRIPRYLLIPKNVTKEGSCSSHRKQASGQYRDYNRAGSSWRAQAFEKLSCFPTTCWSKNMIARLSPTCIGERKYATPDSKPDLVGF